MAMDGSSDDEKLVIPERASKNPESSSFDINDAFSDGDSDHDDHPKFDFSASVRDEIARNLSWIEAQHDSDGEEVERQSSGESGLQDTSISTIDIGGPASILGSHSTTNSSRSRTPEDSIHSTDFSQISLSDDLTRERELSQPQLNVDHEPTDEVHALEQSNEHPYPSVYIDASKSLPSRVEVASTEGRPRASSHLDLPNRSSEDHSGSLPLSAPATSAERSFEIPESSSLPIPATPTKATFTHRPTRSMGPSALEKVISKTRPTFLPPKNKQEDNKHMADWENMMKMSRAAGTSETLCVLSLSLIPYRGEEAGRTARAKTCSRTKN